jgi:hypothetical protein
MSSGCSAVGIVEPAEDVGRKTGAWAHPSLGPLAQAKRTAATRRRILTHLRNDVSIGYSTLAHVSPGCKNAPNIYHNRAASNCSVCCKDEGCPQRTQAIPMLQRYSCDILHLRNREPALISSRGAALEHGECRQNWRQLVCGECGGLWRALEGFGGLWRCRLLITLLRSGASSLSQYLMVLRRPSSTSTKMV